MLESIQRQIKTKKQYTKTYGCNENGSKKEGKFILINVYDKKEEGSQINNLILHTPQGTRKKKKNKLNPVTRRKEILIRAEIKQRIEK